MKTNLTGTKVNQSLQWDEGRGDQGVASERNYEGAMRILLGVMFLLT